MQVRSLALARASQGVQAGNPFADVARQFVKIWRKPYRTPLLYALVMQSFILFGCVQRAVQLGIT